jgi:uncharacterized protein YnzC (UPF0291/DUF896 family)
MKDWNIYISTLNSILKSKQLVELTEKEKQKVIQCLEATYTEAVKQNTNESINSLDCILPTVAGECIRKLRNMV